MRSRTLEYPRANSGITFRPDSNTVLWLPGQDDPQSATIRDRSGNGNDGAITGATWAQTGQGLWYLDFSAGDKVYCGADASVRPDAFTLIAWVKTSVTVNNSLAGWDVNDNEPNFFLAFAVDSRPILFLGGANFRYWENSPVDIYDNNWHMLALTLPGAAQSDIDSSILYADRGVQDISNTTATDVQEARDEFQWGPASARNFTGSMALGRLFNNVLTAAVIANIYSQERHLFGV